MRDELPPIVSIIGRKNSGKTTLTVGLAAELKRRGRRVASVKHGHHDFDIDHPGRDSWRHFHEGKTEAVLMVGGDRIALVMRAPEGDPDPRTLIRDFYAGRGYDLILVEGYKHGPFPKIEIFRRSVHPDPILDVTDPDAAGQFVAVVTDVPALGAPCPVIPLDTDDPHVHVRLLADLLESRILPPLDHAE